GPPSRPAPGRPTRQAHEYVRHGGGIFTATDLDPNTAANFIRFLDDLDAKVPAGLQVHLVLDNGSSHIARNTRWWFVDHPRCHPTPPRPMPGG
ncbi:MAG TPA: IS630 family transposase, partial [Actinomycetes bacterium]|nr:IS630 family transposase [Actinomycetes bacterium]